MFGKMEESRLNENTISEDATEDVTDTMGEVSEQSNSKFSVDCSVQAGSPTFKMVRFKVELDRQNYTGYCHNPNSTSTQSKVWFEAKMTMHHHHHA